jgi:phosphoheptose isomerase|tara:strand:- start:1561 stop:2535 length:975 start_codon:yes stop_codon:yes gene_type:complete
MLNFENLGDKFIQVVQTSEWAALQEKFNNCNDIYVLGHGGNLAVADHAAVDMTRLSNGTKNAICPGSGVVATSYINDSSFEQWMVNWLSARTSTRTKEQMQKSLVLGISSSGNSVDILKALQWATDNGMEIAMMTSKDINVEINNLTKVIIGADYYHTAEVLTLLLTYELTHGSGNVCPPIGKNDPDALKTMNWKGGKIREHSYPDEQINVGIDFDKVIHKCSKGYYDGSIYDEPVEGAYEALERLAKDYTVIVYTCKAKPDRGLVNGKTGTELIWEWLKEHNMSQFVSKVTAEKPRARFYVDDKAIRFTDWESTFAMIEEIDG